MPSQSLTPLVNRVWTRCLLWATCFLLPLLGISRCAAETLPEVVIYVANETAPADEERANYETITGWLDSEESPETDRIVASLNLDRGQFAKAVDVEISDLSLEILKQPSSGGLLIATNRLLRGGQCLLWKPYQKDVQQTAMPTDVRHENFILQANPLSRADILSNVLAYAAGEFDPERYRFVLIIKSHGSGSKVITPRLAVRASETSREEILRLARDEVPEAELPLWTDRLGITKPEFIQVLENAGRQHDMRFSLVFLEACNVTAHEFALAELPEHASRLLVIRERANYLNLLYADIVQQQTKDRSFSESLLEQTSDKFVIVGTSDSLFAGWLAYERLLYFLPLVLWLGWIGWRRRRDAQRVALTQTSPEAMKR